MYLDDFRVTKSEHVLVQVLEGEAVLLNLDNGFYYGLDAVANRMYHLLISCPSVSAAITALEQEYDIAPKKLRADLETLLNDLLKNGLVVECQKPIGIS